MNHKRPLGLTRIVPWSHLLLSEVLMPGQLAVDLTAGNGHDTLFLWRQVGPEGVVLAFDVQSHALEVTRERLQSENAPVWFHEKNASVERDSPGVHLIHDSHAHLNHYLDTAPSAVIANLGYLPGTDQQVITRTDSTRTALAHSIDHLAENGRLAVVAYPGHPGGAEETCEVEKVLRSLDVNHWEVLHLRADNRPVAPLLWVAQKKES